MILLYILHIITICAANELLLPSMIMSSHIYSPAAEIANNHFDLHFDTLLYSNITSHSDDSHKGLFQEFRGGLSNGVIFDEPKQVLLGSRIHYRINQYIIEISNVKTLDYLLKSIKEHKSFEINGKFIIMWHARIALKDVSDAKLAFEICWKFHITNVVILCENEKKQVVILTYFPMSSHQCYSTEPVVLETIMYGHEHGRMINAYPKKFINFHRCKLIISVFHSPPYIYVNEMKEGNVRLGGAEGPLIYILTEQLNATTELITPLDGQFNGYLNETVWTGSLGDIFTYRANMSLGSALITEQRVEYFEAAYPHRMCVFGWISPPSRLRPAWEKLIYPFDQTLRIYFAIFLFILCTVLVILRETRVRRLWNSYFTQDQITNGIYMEMCAIFLGQVCRWRPRHMTLSFALTLWIWFTFVFRNSYQGALIGPLKYDQYDPPFSTLHEAVQEGFEFGGVSYMIIYLAEDPDLYNKYKVIDYDSLNFIVEKIANGTLNFVYLASMEALSQFNLKANKTEQLNFLPQFALVVPLVNYFPRDSPILETVNAMYGRIVASGIEAKHTADNNVVKQYLSSKRLWLEQTDQKLNMRHLQGCFDIAMIGSLASILAFIVEIFWHKWTC